MAITPQQNKIKFRNEYRVFENEIICKISDNEFNISQNPSLTTDSSGSLRPFATGSKFRSYVTTIGLYNNKSQLVAVGKLSQPIQKRDDIDMNFIVRWDY